MAQVNSGDFGTGGDRVQAAEMTFLGTLGPSFIAFVTDRARRLSLAAWARSEPNEVTVIVEGPEALIGCLEISCSLGPIDADVTDWSRVDRAVHGDTEGFDPLN